MKIYSAEEFSRLLLAAPGRSLMIDGKGPYKVGKAVRVVRVKRETIDGEPCIVVYHADQQGEQFGVILSKQYADELTRILGPHPLVEEFFRQH